MDILEKEKGNFKYNVHDIKNKSKYAKKFKFIHFTLKYRLLLPTLEIVDKFFSKYKLKKVPNSEHNYLLKRFDTAFEEALREWYKCYLMTGNYNNKSKTFITREMNKKPSLKRLRSIKDWYITVLSMDQAYKEFHNILMLNLAKELQKEFKGGEANHLLYNSRIIDDVNYFSLFTKIRKEVKIGKH